MKKKISQLIFPIVLSVMAAVTCACSILPKAKDDSFIRGRTVEFNIPLK